MPDDIGLTRELANAAKNLEERFRLLRVPTRRIPDSEWNALPAATKAAIPVWIIRLLSQHSLAAGVLQYHDHIETFQRVFRFAEPEEYKLLFEEDALWWELRQAGFIPFAWEGDGNVWVMSACDSQAGNIYLWEHTNCSPSRPPSVENGLVFASSRLEFLLASMAVSPLSYEDSSSDIRCVLWHSGT